MPGDAASLPDRRLWAVVDCLLMAAALSVGAWTLSHPAMRNAVEGSYQIRVVPEATGSQQTLVIDGTNHIQLENIPLEGPASLADALASPPERVLLLAHPDALLENVIGTVDVLLRRGVKSVQLGTRR